MPEHLSICHIQEEYIYNKRKINKKCNTQRNVGCFYFHHVFKNKLVEKVIPTYYEPTNCIHASSGSNPFYFEQL